MPLKGGLGFESRRMQKLLLGDSPTTSKIEDGHHVYCTWQLNFGFGYVSSLDDYKIVAIALIKENLNTEIVIYVYSLRSKEWTTKRKVYGDWFCFQSYDYPYLSLGALVEENLHWNISEGDHKCIGWFDLAKDEFKIMRLPNFELGDQINNVQYGFALYSINECLCTWRQYWNGRVEVWMMREYGKWGSWTKMFDRNLSDDLYHCCKLVGLQDSGKILIMTRHTNLVLADMNCDPPIFVRLGPIGSARFVGGVSHVHSLISPLALYGEQ
ncbi:F-box protein CPR1-like [Spinacia oleracea]|uniref:F-box protein CPR1-like n=1 Tax=Spinacia oleracea TaxID=3562 RepID=A0ABM3QLW5_SPIOL|nr:F-box protein CPR1-like [Spinacia oleracea]